MELTYESALRTVAHVMVLSGILMSPAFADECTGRVDAYISGLEVGITLIAADSAEADKGRNNIAHIQQLREVKADCEVIRFIPALVNSKKASDAALKAVQKK